MNERIYVISEDFVKALQEVLSSKPYLQVKDVINAIKQEMPESEINQVLQFIGQYPYREVAGIFNAIPEHVKEKSVVNTESGLEPAEPETTEPQIVEEDVGDKN